MLNFFAITRTVWIEYLRRKDFYVVLLLTGIFMLAELTARVIGIKTAAEAEFLMSFGLTMSYFLAGAMTITLASRQIPREFEFKTLYPLLARPVNRFTILAGKVSGVAVLGSATLLLLSLLSYLPIPKSEEQRLMTLGQTLFLETVGLVLLATIAVALSLLTPDIVAALVALTVFLLGGILSNALNLYTERMPSWAGFAASRAFSLVPDFSLFDHIARFVDAQGPMDAVGFCVLLTYGGILILVYFAFSVWALGRRQL